MDARTDLIRPEHVRMGVQGPEVFGAAAATLQAFALIEHVEHGRARQRRDYVAHHLDALIAHARSHSQFWRGRLPAGRAPLSALPVLKRGGLRQQAAEEGPLPVPPDHGPVQANTTSGATSEPLRFHVSALNGNYNVARYAYDDIRGGRRLELPLTIASRKIAAAETLDRWPSMSGEIWRTGPGFVFPLVAETVEALIDAVLRGPGGHLALRPNIIEALIARVERERPLLPPFGDLLTHGETVTDRLRTDAARILGARVCDRYSCEEAGPIAFECPRAPAHHHVCTSNVIVEVLDEKRRPAPDGAAGDIVITALHSLASPVIRYDLGDRGALLPRCPCGHGGPVLARLVGRRASLIRLPDGRLTYYIPGSERLLAIAPVTNWRLLQTGRAALSLQVVAPRPLSDAERDALAALIGQETNAGFAVRIEQVEAIAQGGDKRRMVVNLLEERPG